MIEDRLQNGGDVLAVPIERHLSAVWAALHIFERGATDEIVIELDKRAIAQFVRCNVVVLDVVGDEAAANGGHAFITGRRQPLSIRPHLVAGVDRWQRRGYPA